MALSIMLDLKRRALSLLFACCLLLRLSAVELLKASSIASSIEEKDVSSIGDLCYCNNITV